MLVNSINPNDIHKDILHLHDAYDMVETLIFFRFSKSDPELVRAILVESPRNKTVNILEFMKPGEASWPAIQYIPLPVIGNSYFLDGTARRHSYFSLYVLIL